MAIILKVSPDKLLSTAAELESQGSTMKTYTDQMVNLVNEISGDVWSGDAATAYKTKFSGLQDDIARIHKMVQEHVQDLQDIADYIFLIDRGRKVLFHGLINAAALLACVSRVRYYHSDARTASGRGQDEQIQSIQEQKSPAGGYDNSISAGVSSFFACAGGGKRSSG